MIPNEHEIEVLKMMAGQIEWQHGSWVNACYEFLQEMGLCTRGGRVTEKGTEFLKTLTDPTT